MRFILALFIFVLASCENSHPTYVNIQDATSAIIGGEQVSENSNIATHTVQVGVVFYSSIGEIVEREACSGVLISSNSVLTAAHCFYKKNIQYAKYKTYVLFGADLRTQQSYTTRWALDVIIHPNYIDSDPVSYDDIAIVRLKSPPPTFFKPAKLLKDYTAIELGSYVLSAGYGLSDEITEVSPFYLKAATLQVSLISEKSIDVLNTANGAICSGDSGGPSYIQTPDGIYLWGIHRSGRGKNGLICNNVGTILRIDHHEDFIFPFLD